MDVNIISGVKFAVILSTIALVVWIGVGGGSTTVGADNSSEAALLLLLVGPVKSDVRRLGTWGRQKWDMIRTQD